jgi:hypothetical protein
VKEAVAGIKVLRVSSDDDVPSSRRRAKVYTRKSKHVCVDSDSSSEDEMATIPTPRPAATSGRSGTLRDSESTKEPPEWVFPTTSRESDWSRRPRATAASSGSNLNRHRPQGHRSSGALDNPAFDFMDTLLPDKFDFLPFTEEGVKEARDAVRDAERERIIRLRHPPRSRSPSPKATSNEIEHRHTESQTRTMKPAYHYSVPPAGYTPFSDSSTNTPLQHK